jgi:predicted  nucleic acid-binding Zn-ribbon protein
MIALFLANILKYKTLILSATLFLAVSGTFVYIKYLRSENQTLTANNSLLDSAVKTQQQTIEKLQQDVKYIKNAKDKLTSTLLGIQKSTQALQAKLETERQQIKLSGSIAAADLVIKNVLRCIELQTGAKLKANETTKCGE